MLEGREPDVITDEAVAALGPQQYQMADVLKSAPAAERQATVKKPDLFGRVTDTFQTEAELNGFRQSQGRLL